MTSGAPALSRRQLLERYTHLREDHLRYMQKWGLIRPSHRAHGETFYAFPDLTVIRDADENLGNGASFRAVLRSLLASHRGQLAFDFRIEAQPAKVPAAPAAGAAADGGADGTACPSTGPRLRNSTLPPPPFWTTAIPSISTPRRRPTGGPWKSTRISCRR
jgi:hypothetical protein